MITYKEVQGKPTKVILGRKVVGEIRTVPGGYQYLPLGQKKYAGEVFATLRGVKDSIEGKERTFEVFYVKEPLFLEADKELTVKNMKDSHVLVRALMADSLDHVYAEMQGEIWSPHGEMRQHIKKCGLNHTSMSVGDVAHDTENGKYYQVDNEGWLEVPME